MTQTIITAKVYKATRDFSRIVSKELKPFEGKIIKFQILEVTEQKPAQDAEITRTVNVPVNQVVT